jgi:hypothetical protein
MDVADDQEQRLGRPARRVQLCYSVQTDGLNRLAGGFEPDPW